MNTDYGFSALNDWGDYTVDGRNPNYFLRVSDSLPQGLHVLSVDFLGPPLVSVNNGGGLVLNVVMSNNRCKKIELFVRPWVTGKQVNYRIYAHAESQGGHGLRVRNKDGKQVFSSDQTMLNIRHCKAWRLHHTNYNQPYPGMTTEKDFETHIFNVWAYYFRTVEVFVGSWLVISGIYGRSYLYEGVEDEPGIFYFSVTNFKFMAGIDQNRRLCFMSDPELYTWRRGNGGVDDIDEDTFFGDAIITTD